MLPTIEALGLLALLTITFLLYRWLIHSPWFANLVNGIMRPSSESPNEALKNLRNAKQDAWQVAQNATKVAAKAKREATEIKRQVKTRRTKSE